MLCFLHVSFGQKKKKKKKKLEDGQQDLVCIPQFTLPCKRRVAFRAFIFPRSLRRGSCSLPRQGLHPQLSLSLALPRIHVDGVHVCGSMATMPCSRTVGKGI